MSCVVVPANEDAAAATTAILPRRPHVARDGEARVPVMATADA
jgi:hypothetical protein